MKWGWLVLLVLLFGVGLVGCRNREVSSDVMAEDGLSFNWSGFEVKQLLNSGGRVAWYQGEEHDLIAYDAIVNKWNKSTELFVMNADGSGQRCVTCEMEQFPRGFRGQPAWYPGGEYLLIQAENEFSDHNLFNHMAWGVNNDLWLIKLDGSSAEKVWDTPEDYAALHAHFDEDGNRLLFAERELTGTPIVGGDVLGTHGGENQWTGWRVRLGDFNMDADNKLSDVQVLFDDIEGMYETHKIAGDFVYYSHTPNGRAYVDDIYQYNLLTEERANLTNDGKTWEEHGALSPVNSKLMAYMSSEGFAFDGIAGDKAVDFQSELWIKNLETEEKQQVTYFNRDVEEGYVVSDFDWSADGTAIVLQAAKLERGAVPELWLVEGEFEI